ncbi:hypothetical protein IHE55_01970 [Streptomyces pactum]|uniref:Uncharacterized protein n=1 Tax=Streptomyces pactum TaxID=68249 RepID=A0ABS0NEL8_9ACTN|nr:hypothetical protein [Streptomyces pactum]MBH5333637.1 hypothetical protein [Streptomyces pactum]
MTVPEENRGKSSKTDDTVLHPDRLREERERRRPDSGSPAEEAGTPQGRPDEDDDHTG